MFSIGFVSLVEPAVRAGEITIGAFKERFESPMDYWDRTQYESHWREQLSRVLAGASTAALITSMIDPLQANFIVWWPIYREGSIVRVQQHLLFLDALEKRFDPTHIADFVRPRTTANEDGDRISEWTTSVTDIARFLQGD